MSTNGWVIFSGVMLFMAGLFGVIDGLVAIVNEEVFLVTDEQAIVVDVSTWGWVHLAVGVATLVTGLAVLGGQLWAVILGVFIAIVSATSQLLFITVFPWWSLAIMAIDVLVIYGLVVHGAAAAEAAQPRGIEEAPAGEVRGVAGAADARSEKMAADGRR